MNLIGKIFVILIMVMSLVVLGGSVALYSTHKNWREIITKQGGLNDQMAQLDARNKELQSQLETLTQTLNTERETRQGILGQLETERAQLEADYNQLVNEEATQLEDLRQRTAALQAAQATLDKRLAEIDQLRKDIDTTRADRDQRFTELVQLTDKYQQAEGELERLKARNLLLSEQMAQARQVLESRGLKLDAPVDYALFGKVLESTKEGLVEITIGADDGMEIGTTLEVYRLGNGQNKYLGRIEVMKTWPDKSVAKVIPEFRRGNIQKEDRVATRFNN